MFGTVGQEDFIGGKQLVVMGVVGEIFVQTVGDIVAVKRS